MRNLSGDYCVDEVVHLPSFVSAGEEKNKVEVRKCGVPQILPAFFCLHLEEESLTVTVACSRSRCPSIPINNNVIFFRQIDPTMSGRDREAQAVIDALQDVYREKLRPIEELSMFDMVSLNLRTSTSKTFSPQSVILHLFPFVPFASHVQCY